MAEKDTPIMVTGSVDWSQGVDSIKTTTQASVTNPNGLTAQQLGWLINATVRNGSIDVRSGFVYRGTVIGQGGLTALLGQPFQGKFVYTPPVGNPYEIWNVGGNILKVDPTFAAAPVNLSAIFNLYHPAGFKNCFEQGNKYLVIQAGDYNPQTGLGTLPLFWDGTTLTRSNGFTGIISGALTPVEFGFTPSPAFSVPAISSSVTVGINTSYPGIVNATFALYAQSAQVQEFIGNFTVTAATTDSLTLKTVSLSGSPRGVAGAVIATNCTLESIPVSGGHTVVFTTNNVTFGNLGTNTSNAAYPPGGASQTITFGNADGGTTIPTTNQQINVYGYTPGSAKVFLIGTGLVTAITAPGNVPTSMTITWEFITAMSQNQPPLYLIWCDGGLSPTVGNSWSLLTDTIYGGSVGDTVYVSGSTIVNNNVVGNYQFGTYQVTALNPITLKAIYSGAYGQPIIYDPFYTQGYTISSNFYLTTGSGLIQQIPAALSMKFYMGRLWYSQGATVSAGDIIGGANGTLLNNFTDSILCVTENPLSVGGDGFTMPSGNDNITGLGIPQMINASLGEGLLNIGTNNGLFALQVPVSRADWIAADSNNQPNIFVIQSGTANGPSNDWGIVPVNGDLWYTRPDAEIMSILTAVRYFQQWGNVLLSSNEDYILSLVNQNLLPWVSGVYFNNRVLNLTLPQQSNYGVYFPAIVPLDLTTISTLEQQNPPNWEGHYEGLNILKIDVASYGNQQRCFMAALNPSLNGTMEVWELVQGQVGDQSQTSLNRIQWQASMCSFTWGDEFQLKELVGGELWLDNIQGVVDVKVQYVPDGNSCPQDWCEFSVCNAQNSTQLPPGEKSVYPPIVFQPGYRKPLQFPKPPDKCEGGNNRPMSYLYECQPIITIKGKARIRGLRLYATKRHMSIYENLIKTGNQVIQWAKKFLVG